MAKNMINENIENIENEEIEEVKKVEKNISKKATVTCAALNVRSIGELNSSIVEVLMSGDEVTVNGKKNENGFVPVTTASGKNGFVISEFISFK